MATETKKKFQSGDVVYHRSNGNVKWVVNESYNDDTVCKVELVTSDGKTQQANFPTVALSLYRAAGED